MEITEVRIKLMGKSDDRLRAFCSITIDNAFVIRDLKIIEGNNGPFVAMPSRKLTSNCYKCRSKNHLRARYCSSCGAKQRTGDTGFDQDGRPKLYADIAHPINAECREMIQRRVISELEAELQLASQPGYQSKYDDDYESRQVVEKQDAKNLQAETPTAVEGDTVEKPIEKKRIDAPRISSSPHSDSGSTSSAPSSDQSLRPSKKPPDGPSQSSQPDVFGRGIFD